MMITNYTSEEEEKRKKDPERKVKSTRRRGKKEQSKIKDEPFPFTRRFYIWRKTGVASGSGVKKMEKKALTASSLEIEGKGFAFNTNQPLRETYKKRFNFSLSLCSSSFASVCEFRFAAARSVRFTYHR